MNTDCLTEALFYTQDLIKCGQQYLLFPSLSGLLVNIDFQSKKSLKTFF